MAKLTKAQRRLLVEMGDNENALRNGDEGDPQWWIEGGDSAHKAVAESLVRRGFVTYTRKWGGDPGVLGFTMTPAGRAALAETQL